VISWLQKVCSFKFNNLWRYAEGLRSAVSVGLVLGRAAEAYSRTHAVVRVGYHFSPRYFAAVNVPKPFH
jgi:hypothetical protein